MQRFRRRRVFPPRTLYVFMACCIATVNIGPYCTASCDVERATPLDNVSIPGCVPLRVEYSGEWSSPPCVARCSAAALCFSNSAVIAVELQRWNCVNLVGTGITRAPDASWKEVIVVTHHGRLTTPLFTLNSFVKNLD